MKNKIFIITFVFVTIYGLSAQAMQVYQFNEKLVVEGVISNTELNRIKIEGERIKQIIGLSKQYQAEGEPQQGQVFIKANSGVEEPAIFSVITETGKTQDFRLTPKKQKGEIILIETVKNVKDGKEIPYGAKHSTHFEMIEVIKKIAYESILDEKLQKEEEKEIGCLKAKLLKAKRLNGYLVEVWSLKNEGANNIKINERNFEFAGMVKAIALENLILNPLESTTMYVVKL
jgi:hypothetical protein